MKKFVREEDALKGMNMQIGIGTQQEPNYTRFLVGTYLDPVQGWTIAYAPFDPVTKQVGEISTERAAGDEAVMRERLMIKEVNLGLFESAPITAEKKEDIY